MTLSEQVKRSRKRMKLTQVQVAQLAGITQSAISKIESGKMRDPAFSIVMKLKNVLKFKLEELK